jgi:hypothetical protein
MKILKKIETKIKRLPARRLGMALLVSTAYSDYVKVAGVAFGDGLLAAGLVRIWRVGLPNSLTPLTAITGHPDKPG